jgi:hypothetical protein
VVAYRSRPTRRALLSWGGGAATFWGLHSAGLAGAAALLGTGCERRNPRSPPEDRGVLARAARWLLAQQDGDGAFRSRTYGLLASGQSLTPFVTQALQEVLPVLPPGPRVWDVAPRPSLLAGPIRGAVNRALDWMLATCKQSDPPGALGLAGDGVPDYPVYATAMAVSALAAAGRTAEAAPLRAWLLSQQLRAEDGWGGSAAEGGFPMGSRVRPQPPHPGHVDLSMTRRALQALAASGSSPDSPEMRAGARFVRGCRSAQGFIYSPVEELLNKGERVRSLGAPDRPEPLGSMHPYGSATCDGVLALLAAGLPPEDPDVSSALQALRRWNDVDGNPGTGLGPMPEFYRAMRFYYRAGSAELFARLGGPEAWTDLLFTALELEQAPDGSFRNESALQKEDDPIVATGFALRAAAFALAAGRLSAAPRSP